MPTRGWTGAAWSAALLLGVVPTGGCGSAVVDDFSTCTLALELSAPSGAAGDTITLGGGPFTEVRDTRVYVDGVQAEVVEVTRTGCDACDQCRSDAGCAPCGRCLGEDLEPATRKQCFGDPFEGTSGDCGLCEQTMAFVVPTGPVGATEVWVVNRDGTSDPVPFEVVAATDPSPTGDTGASTP